MRELGRHILGADRYAAGATAVSNVVSQLRRWLHRRPRVSLAPKVLRPVLHRFAAPGGHTFFGYHDLIPFSADGARLLAIHTSSSTARAARIGWFDATAPNRSFKVAASTETWCWQQGCRLQWHPAAPNSRILFNRIVDGELGAAEFDIELGQTVREYPVAIYAMDDSGRAALSLNFARLQRLRPGYGYAKRPDATAGDRAPADDGLWRLDMNTGESQLLLSLASIAEFRPTVSMNSAEHYLNHLSFSPGGQKILFFHLWRGKGARHSRMLMASADGTDLALVSPHRASHVCWLSDKELLAYTVDDHGDGRYRRFPLGQPVFDIPGGPELYRDGHPMAAPSGDVVIDTYPDGFAERTLALLDPRTGHTTQLATFYSPPWLVGEQRCDLHPRFNLSGGRIAFDSAHEGRRRLYVLDLVP